MMNEVKNKLTDIVTTFPPVGDDWEYEIPVGYIPSEGKILVCLENDIDDVCFEHPDVEFAFLECSATGKGSVSKEDIVNCLYEQAETYKRICTEEE